MPLCLWRLSAVRLHGCISAGRNKSKQILCGLGRFRITALFPCMEVIMDSLKTIEGKVRAVLQENEDARNDDMVLYLALCNLYLKDAGAMPLAQILLNHKELGLPSFESVGRTRRKLQEKYPELLGSVRMQKIRARGEKAYRRYAKES